MAAYTAIDDPGLYFNTVLYTGDGASTLAITGVGFQPDFTWIKVRTLTHNHTLFDSVRGATKVLESNLTNAENARANSLKSFDTDGFTLGDWDNVNDASDTFVGWNWKESATAGFDIVLYTGNATARTISHSLSAVPKVIMPKSRSATYEWRLYHAGNTSAPETDFIVLNQDYATTDNLGAWNDTAPTSSVFTLGDGETPNNDGTTYVTYLWSEVQGFSKFGSYTGNGNDDGPFIYTGFRPAWTMIKLTSGTDNWVVDDNKRSTSNIMQNTLFPNANTAEYTGSAYGIDFLSNGFKIRNDDGQYNNSGGTYIYMAFAEAPFVNSEGVPCNAR